MSVQALDRSNPLVTLRNVGKVFPARRPGADRVQALCPTDIDIAHGEFLTIVGPSGCGKSTLLSLISGLQRASSGEIRVGNTVERARLTPATPEMLRSAPSVAESRTRGVVGSTVT